jgi:hypothetical protein|nr:MAG TPA: Baseplate wedge protein [Caudoviricetes sp.]
MKYTANHKLKLPEPADTLDIAVLDENFINIDALIAALQSGKADKNSPSLTGTPTAPTAASGTNSAQIATTAFVQMLVKRIDDKLTELSASTLDNAYALLLLDKDNISLCSDMDSYGISYDQFENGIYDRGIMCIENNVTLPRRSHAPVFFKSWASKSGDASEIYNVQMLLYLDGTVYARHRYLWTISSGGNGVVKNPTWSEWSTEDFYASYKPQSYFIKG